MNAPPSDIAWFTILMGAVQFLTAVVIALVCFIIRGMMTSHKELSDSFRNFQLEYATVSISARSLEQHHARISAIEDTVLIMGSELHAKGAISQLPKIAQGQGWR